MIPAAEACRTYDPTGEWGAVAIEEAFDYLKAPVTRVTGRATPVPFADSIEQGVLPDSQDILKAIHFVMDY